MKKILIILGLITGTLVSAAPQIQHQVNDSLEISKTNFIENYSKKYQKEFPLEVKKYQNVLSVDTKNELVTCALFPFSKEQTQKLFGTTNQLHKNILPIDVVITNHSTQNLFIPLSKSLQHYLIFPQYQLESYEQFLQQYDNAPWKKDLLASGGIFSTVYGLHSLWEAFDQSMYPGIPSASSNTINVKTSTINGSLSLAFASYLGYLYYQQCRKIKARDAFKFEISTRALFNKLHGSRIINPTEPTLVIAPGKSDLSMVFIDTKKYPDAEQTFTNPDPSAPIAQLPTTYELK